MFSSFFYSSIELDITGMMRHLAGHCAPLLTHGSWPTEIRTKATGQDSLHRPF